MSNYLSSGQRLLNKIGNNIREFRVKLGYSQERLAKKCGLNRTYIGSVERGERNISIINLKKIADALQTDINKILKF